MEAGEVHPEDYVSALGVGSIDLAIAPVSARERDAVAISSEPLLKENFRCVVRRGHPLTRQRLTVARYVAYPHVIVAPQGTRWSFVDDALEALGKRRRVACTVPHFLVAPNLLGQTDLVLTLTERIVREHMHHLDLVDLPLPLTIPPLTVSMVWHGRNSQEPGHVWLRGILSEIAAST